ncbi:MAG: glutathione peroxidase [Spirochaetales bacterium]|nr:glutathione peroxidase [Spirochaetales bacterium]
MYSFFVKDIEGNVISLSEYQGKTIMIVNVASKCGFTPQYEGLEALYRQYKDRGFVILGFPSNDFLWQESGSNEEIKAFCTLNYGVTFPMFSKIRVKGKNADPLYQYLTGTDTNPEFGGKITWNFNKFLIDSEGNIVNRFESSTEPLSGEVVSALEGLLD